MDSETLIGKLRPSPGAQKPAAAPRLLSVYTGAPDGGEPRRSKNRAMKEYTSKHIGGPTISYKVYYEICLFIISGIICHIFPCSLHFKSLQPLDPNS